MKFHPSEIVGQPLAVCPSRHFSESKSISKTSKSSFIKNLLLAAILLALPHPVLAAPTAYANAVLADSPYLYYRLGETSGTTVSDSSGNARNGTYAGGFTLAQAGDIAGGSGDNAVLLDGTSGYVTTPASAESFGTNMAHCSFEFVFKTASGYAAAGELAGVYNGSGGQDNFHITLNENATGGAAQNEIRFYVGNDDADYNAVYFTDAAVFDGNYHHLVYVNVSGTMTAYVDGVAQTTHASAAGTVVPFIILSHPFYIGAQNNGNNGAGQAPFAAATMDEVAFYPVALTAQQVAAHYNALTKPVLTSLFNGTTLAGWAQNPSGSFIVNATDKAIETSGSARGFIYTTNKSAYYRVIYSVKQNVYLHFPCVLFFGYSATDDAMDAMQFQLPKDYAWDYRPGKNVSPTTGLHTYGSPDPNTALLNTWFRCELLVNSTNLTGTTADSAAALLGGTAQHVMSITDATITNIPCPFAIQCHQTHVDDEYKDILIEVNPQYNGLVLLNLPAPVITQAATPATNQVNLTWTINSTTQTGFEVFHSTDNLNWHLMATLASNATTYSDTNLIPNSTYYYRVSAITATAISDYATTNVTLGSVVAVSGGDTWVGGTDNNFSTTANWSYSSGSGPVASGDSLVFAAAGSTTPNNDETSFSFPAINFASGAQAYTIGGNSFTLGTGTAATVISVSSANAQTINNNITLGNAVQTISLLSGNLTLGGTVSGAGTASGLLVNSNNVLTIANAAFTGNLTVGQPAVTGGLAGQLTINGGTFGSPNSTLTIATDLGTGSAVKSFIMNGGTATFGPVNIAIVGGETGAAMEIAGSASASFGSVTNGSSSNTGGNLTINTTGTVNLGNATFDRNNGANTYQTPTEGLVLTAGTVTATNLFSSSSIGLRVGDININGGSLTVGTSASTGAFKLGVANGAATGVGNAALTMTGGSLTYLGTDGLLVGNNATTANASYLVSINGSGAVASLTGITLNNINSANQTNRLTLGSSATLYLGGVGLIVKQPGGYNNATFGTATVGALANWSSSAPITLIGTPVTFQAADSNGLPHNINLSGALSGTGALTKTGDGTLTLSGANTYTGNTIVTNGTLALSGSGSIASSANIVIGGGATLDVSGSPSGLLTLAGGQTLSGNGMINGSVTSVANSTIVPGGLSAAGTLTMTNTATLGGYTIMLLNNAGNSSQLVATNINYGGTLTVSNLGPALAAGNSFNLFTAAGYNGAFANVVLPALPAGLGWNTNALNSSGTLSVVVTASPNIGAISISGDGGGLLFGGTGGVANANYYLLATTNVAVPLSDWTRLLTNQFDNNGNFNFTNPVDINSSQNFYRLQIP